MATKKILVITAHPDDLEIGCAGALHRWQQEGAEITSIITVRPIVDVPKKQCGKNSMQVMTSVDGNVWSWEQNCMPTDALI